MDGADAFDYALSDLASWDDGFSSVQHVEYPVDDDSQEAKVLEARRLDDLRKTGRPVSQVQSAHACLGGVVSSDVYREAYVYGFSLQRDICRRKSGCKLWPRRFCAGFLRRDTLRTKIRRSRRIRWTMRANTITTLGWQNRLPRNMTLTFGVGGKKRRRFRSNSGVGDSGLGCGFPGRKRPDHSRAEIPMIDIKQKNRSQRTEISGKIRPGYRP